MKQPAPLLLEGNLSENWEKFIFDFENFLFTIGRGKEEDKKKIAFLETYIGDCGLQLLDSFDINEVDKSKYYLIIRKLEEFCNRQNKIVGKRFEFLNTRQKEGQSFDDYLETLKSKISSCEFGEEEDNMLRDVLINGLRDSDIQGSLLEQTDLTLEKTIKYIRAAEEALQKYLKMVLRVSFRF